MRLSRFLTAYVQKNEGQIWPPPAPLRVNNSWYLLSAAFQKWRRVFLTLQFFFLDSCIINTLPKHSVRLDRIFQMSKKTRNLGIFLYSSPSLCFQRSSIFRILVLRSCTLVQHKEIEQFIAYKGIQDFYQHLCVFFPSLLSCHEKRHFRLTRGSSLALAVIQ